jgi:hypothetical protein
VPTLQPTPTPTPAPSCPASLQTAINNTPTGGTLTLGACTFRESVTVSRAMTIRGPATIDGQGVRSTWMTVTGNDVTVDGLTMKNAAAGGTQSGSLNVDGGDRFHLRNAALSGGSYANLRVWYSLDSVIEDSDFGYGRVIGIVGWDSDRTIVRRVRAHHNNLALIGDPGWEAGGIKFCESSDLTFADSEVDHNAGVGAWFDCRDNGSDMVRMRAHHNTWAGLMIEIQDGGSIRDSQAWENGWGDPRWDGWAANILVSSSGNITVAGNQTAWARQAISVISQNRDAPASNGRGINVSNNIVTKSPLWYQDWSGPLNTDSGNIRTPNTTVGSGDSRLTTVGIPGTPESH